LLANDIYKIVVELLDSMQNQLFGKYTLTRYLIIYLIREALETDALGKELCLNPTAFLKGDGARDRVVQAVKKVATSIVKLVDTEATRRSQMSQNGNEFFDYKSDLKSPRKIADIRAAIVSHYQIVIDNRYAPTFSEAWSSSDKRRKAAKKGRTK
jgi:hypothetical protein